MRAEGGRGNAVAPSGMNSEDCGESFGNLPKLSVGDFAEALRESFLCHGADLEGVSGGRFTQTVVRIGIESYHPGCGCVAILPFGDRHDDFQRKDSDRIVVDDDGGAGLADFSANGRVEIDQPNFAIYAWNGSPSIAVKEVNSESVA